ncbi:hypothetical protein [Pseudovibrio sp. SPO723]|uniref:hypothetical protein n=1 Tax=Nesiotobacter zosterae TaxID=392721 RepID=UPI0029C33190|nr:hypothetical protein [Pseudovibrio sp. SPO723]MDX5592537.1 hypothetical protein [Pseudovibrio sp. SPO723]
MASNPFYFIKKGNALFPASQYDAERLGQFKEGSQVSCSTLSQKRSIPHHRRYWVGLSEIVRATECAPNAEKLHQAIKLALGYVSPVVTASGDVVRVPDSTSFSQMDEKSFQQFTNQADAWCLENLGVGIFDSSIQEAA